MLTVHVAIDAQSRIVMGTLIHIANTPDSFCTGSPALPLPPLSRNQEENTSVGLLNIAP